MSYAYSDSERKSVVFCIGSELHHGTTVGTAMVYRVTLRNCSCVLVTPEQPDMDLIAAMETLFQTQISVEYVRNEIVVTEADEVFYSDQIGYSMR